MKTVLVTGGNRGIGWKIVQYLVDHQYCVALNYRSKLSEEVKKFVEENLQQVLLIQGDVTDSQSAKEMIGSVKDHWGSLDVLVNNAGITKDGLSLSMSDEDFDQVIQTNLKGTFNMCKHVAKIMIKQKSGKIINMSSVVGITGNAGQANYAASKAGVIGLTKSLAKELASRSITVNAIAPGFIETEMTDVLKDKIKQEMLNQIPLKRFGQATEVAQVVRFLLEHDYITGQVIEVNGGLHI